MRSLFRRIELKKKISDGAKLEVDGLTLDEQSMLASRGETDLNLTPVEFKVLWLLLKNVGSVVTRDNLFHDALGRREQTFDRSLDMHISRIRKKIWPDTVGLKKIKNIRSEGYLFVAAKEEQDQS
jgi:two-component system response regulator PfeR